MMRNAAILLGVFLLGLIPPLVRTMQLKKELASSKLEIAEAETRNLAALGYLEVSRNNFSVAAQYASELFTRLDTASRTGDEPSRAIAAEGAKKRDSVMGMLATADPRAKSEFQDLVSLLNKAGRPPEARALSK